jgi:hypothetical protein
MSCLELPTVRFLVVAHVYVSIGQCSPPTPSEDGIASFRVERFST